jgi:nucleoside-diphosphate-sugar epimerase
MTAEETRLAMAYWGNARVLVTGGTSFIGSHLIDRLVALGADVRVADDLSIATHNPTPT